MQNIWQPNRFHISASSAMWIYVACAYNSVKTALLVALWNILDTNWLLSIVSFFFFCLALCAIELHFKFCWFFRVMLIVDNRERSKFWESPSPPFGEISLFLNWFHKLFVGIIVKYGSLYDQGIIFINLFLNSTYF